MPPCQPFSRQRRGVLSEDDERLALVNQLLRFIKRYLPELLFIENVPGFRRISTADYAFKSFLKEIHDLGYFTDYRIIRCQEYGVPQRRARFVLLASNTFPVTIPLATHGHEARLANVATVRDWIGGFPAISAGETHLEIPNHRAAKLSPLNLRRIRATPEGGSWPNLSPDLIPRCHKSGFRGYTDVYGRLRWDSPAPAMTTRCISYSNGRFGHPEQDRAISIREAASLQTFPEDFVFEGSLNSQARQVGNAVPMLLSQRFGESILEQMRNFATSPRHCQS